MKCPPDFDPTIIRERILAWYARNQRDLPWRNTRDPYRIWVSEIMLQQTQVDTVIPYYHRFLERFPTVADLAGASMDEVLKVWENLGYYSRARHMHAAAGEIVGHLNGRFPSSAQDLQRLPGIGTYTASAVMSFAFGDSVPTVDGNFKRVLSRVFAIRESIEKVSIRRLIYAIAAELVPPGDSSGFNQGLMDLGATLCLPRRPSCGNCPLQDLCLAFQRGIQETLPVKSKRPPLPHRVMTAAVVRDAGRRLLVVQRPFRGLLGGLWKFPGGERRPREGLEQALERSVRDELGISIKAQEAIASVSHTFTHFRMTLHAWRCVLTAGSPRALGCMDWQWITWDGLSHGAFSRADRKIMEILA
ncbi:MAG: A/G-specific adenine glycosylase [Desulfatiglandales bacterium]